MDKVGKLSVNPELGQRVRNPLQEEERIRALTSLKEHEHCERSKQNAEGKNGVQCRNVICPSHPSVIKHTAQLKDWSRVGADGRIPTQMLRGKGGVQRLFCNFDKNVLSLPFALASRKRLGCQVRLSGLFGVEVNLVVLSSEHPFVSLLCRMVRQFSVEERRMNLFEVQKRTSIRMNLCAAPNAKEAPTCKK